MKKIILLFFLNLTFANMSNLLGMGCMGELSREDSVKLGEAFRFAIINGRASQVESLISGGVCVNVVDSHGLSPLINAVINRKLVIVEMLLLAGACVNDLGMNENTTLHYAATNGYSEIIEILVLWGADVQWLNDLRQTPADLAKEHGFHKIAEYLYSLY